MLVVLPLLSYLSILLVIENLKILESKRGSILFACVIWGVLVVIITEILSLFHQIAVTPLVSVWGLVLLLCLTFLAYKNQKINLRFSFWSENYSKLDLFFVMVIFAIVVILGLIAWFAPPNSWDSMTYHMSRVMYWIQDRSIAFYPTHILRQLHQSPWAEFAILQFQLLSGGDRLANFIQWFSMVGCLIGVTLLAKEFGADRRGQILAAVFCGTLPMGMLQATSTQNDYVVSFWLVCFAYFLLRFKIKLDVFSAFGLGVSLGLALLTKATAYLYAFSFMAWLGISSLKPDALKKTMLIVFVITIALLVNLGHYLRNYNLYKNPLGPGFESGGYTYVNEMFILPAIMSNIVRNVALHAGTPLIAVNNSIESAIDRFHGLMDISPNDARTTWKDTEFSITYFPTDENWAGNSFHLLFVLISLLLFLKRRPASIVGSYSMALLAGFLLFCIYLKWQPWHSRLHLPLFVLVSPCVGLLFSQIKNYNIPYLAFTFLVLLSIPSLTQNTNRPLLGGNNVFTTSRHNQYFVSQPELLNDYSQAAQILAGAHCFNIGLVLEENDGEYPLWVFLQSEEGGVPHLEHVNVKNISQILATHYPAFNPCAVFVINSDLPASVSVQNDVFLKAWSADSIGIYFQQ